MSLIVKPKKTIPLIAKPKQTHAGQTVKPSPKAKAKTTLPPSSKDTDALITLFAKLLNDEWKQEEKILAFLTSINDNVPNTGLDSLYILTTSLHKANSTDSGDFEFST